MKESNAKKKLRAVLIAALLGAAICAGISMLVFWSDSNLVWIISLPADYLNQVIKLDGVFPVFVNSVAFGLIVNGFIGALIFAAVAGLLQFVLKSGCGKN